MLDQISFILGIATFYICLVFLISWGGVILIVNPALDPLFYNDKYFDWFLQRAHPFFFSFRALWYAGAVTSRWLAKRSMGIEEDSFRERVGPVGRFCCWTLTSCMFIMPFGFCGFLLFDFLNKHVN